MLRSYIHLAYRNLSKNKVASLINVFGLSVAIGCCVVVYLFLDRSLSSDRFHENGDRIFLVGNVIDRDGSLQRWGDSPMPLGPAMAGDMPQVQQAVRVDYGSGTMQYRDRVFVQSFWYVDPAFLDVFTFPLRRGSPDALQQPDGLVLSDAVATKYFGDDDPIGKEVTIKIGDRLVGFTVRGVAEPFEDTASFRFDLLMGYDHEHDAGRVALDDWSAFTGATFIVVNESGDVPAIARNMDRYRARQNAVSDDWTIRSFTFTNLYDLSLESNEVRRSIAGGPHPAAFVVLPLIALFLLALACFNYMNIAIATASRRLKEIGVRKALGSSKRQLVVQFLSENVLLCFIALAFGIVLAQMVLIPGFNRLMDDVQVRLAFFDNLRLWAFLVILLGLVGLASGAYPAFYVAGFSPTAIFQGKQRLAGKRIFTSTSLALQFVLAFLTMIAGVIFVQNAHYQASQDWGYDASQVLGLRLTEAADYGKLEPAIRQNPDVVSFASSTNHVARSSRAAIVDVHGTRMEARRYDVGFRYLETLGLHLASGRFFDEARGGDARDALVVNRSFARKLGWRDDAALGQTVRFDSTAFGIIGVVDDFLFDDFFDGNGPAFFRIGNPDHLFYLVVRTKARTTAQTASFLEQTWKRLIPDKPYDGFYQDQAFDYFYRDNDNITRVFTFTALMALIISCMGLFGLVSQSVARRTREIGIRKVLGATDLHVTSIVNRGFLVLLLVAAVAATPLAAFSLGALLDSIYRFRVPIGAGPFVLSYALVFVTALVTMATQVRKVVNTRPAEVLRNE